ncbi:hypothetical protein CONLIGDRAFT_678379 [Coniochaeta ligniaria NRRL 30616]|uniref:Uncharacterized protein n=1 Tax=Coniochaeta ligniaria NRRL 30616 TaxID=1408157 RepID=A0A1J7IWR6_9PEZI|nr:hypothetical protein CONLIGDRAFT_678379 [Coniochaeta ligniaria NRRL 30616]
MEDYKTINDWHLSSPWAYRKAMEELSTAFQELSVGRIHELESSVGRTLGIIANLFRSTPIPDEPSTWGSQITTSLEQEGLEFDTFIQRWFVYYLSGKGTNSKPVPLPRALEVIFRLCPTTSELYSKTRAVYRAGIALAVLTKSEVHFRYYAVRALRLEESIKQDTTHSSLEPFQSRRLFAVAHMNFALAEASEGQWKSALDYLYKATLLHKARKGGLSVSRIRPELMSTRQDLFEVYYHVTLVLLRLAENPSPDDPYDEMFWLYDDAKRAHELARTQLQPRPSNHDRRMVQLDHAMVRICLSRLLTMGSPRRSLPYYDGPVDRKRDMDSSLRSFFIAWLGCRRLFDGNHRWTASCDYIRAWLHVLAGQSCTAVCNALKSATGHLRGCPSLRRDYTRAAFLYSRCLRAMKKDAEADTWLARSVVTYNLLRPDDQRDETSLKWKDIHGLVVYEYLDSLDVEFGDYNNDGYMESWFEPETEPEPEEMFAR